MNSISILEAVNTSSVQFHGQPIITAMVVGAAYVAMRTVVENIGIDWTGQSVKLRTQREKFDCRDISMVAADGRVRKLLCIPLKKLNGWLFSINPSKVRADIRDKLIAYQEECFTVLHDYWTKGAAVRKPGTTVDERTPLRDAVNMLVSKKHLMYPEAYSIIHQRFAVESIEELTSEQIPQAIEYVHRVVLDGEYLGKQIELPQVASQFTDDELCTLSWLWSYATYMCDYMKQVYPILRAAEHKLAGAYYSMPLESPRTINAARTILCRETSHIESGLFRQDNFRVFYRMRRERDISPQIGE
ncbi:Uncharacterised protein [Serratia grimesii]|uniref:phage antirepressor N-terminal domain-containing protein n=1 Tax=Serratia grimesii TaxID=82995 RepID=UPI00076F3CF4|nr:phage antirepressor N-terminal domain-containing protein [Serratia grimesii]CUW11828.1 Uncharacterised protein [Serratia grimesii]SMZ56193.1 Uncharacterised protein [Serratia grimesii]